MATNKPLKKETVRERVNRSGGGQKQRGHRLKGAGKRAGQPVKRVLRGATREYHVMPQQDSGFVGFMTRSRSLFPSYIANSWRELRQVSWPTRRTTWKLVFAVFAFAIFFGVLISVVDYGLEKIFRPILL